MVDAMIALACTTRHSHMLCWMLTTKLIYRCMVGFEHMSDMCACFDGFARQGFVHSLIGRGVNAEDPVTYDTIVVS